MIRLRAIATLLLAGDSNVILGMTFCASGVSLQMRNCCRPGQCWSRQGGAAGQECLRGRAAAHAPAPDRRAAAGQACSCIAVQAGNALSGTCGCTAEDAPQAEGHLATVMHIR